MASYDNYVSREAYDDDETNGKKKTYIIGGVGAVVVLILVGFIVKKWKGAAAE